MKTCRQLIVFYATHYYLLHQIVITGVGCVTPVGIGADVSYKAMCEGKSGIRKLPSWADEYPAQVAY